MLILQLHPTSPLFVIYCGRIKLYQDRQIRKALQRYLYNVALNGD